MKQKLLALLLALAMVLSFATVFAAEETDSAPPSEVETLTEEPVTEPAPEKVDLKKQIVPESEVPDLIDYDIAVEEKYVCRAYWEETALNEVVFLKADGALARYVFSFPVKYEADGEVYDKQPELVARETLLANTYRYELTAQNDTTLYCAENLSNGFFFQGEDMQVNLRPITKDEYDFLRGHIDAGSVVTPIGGTSLTTYNSVAVTGTAQSALATEAKSTTAALYALSTTGQQASLAAVQDTLAVVPCYTGFQLQLDLAEGATSTTLYFELDPNGLILARPADTLLLYDKYGNTVGIVGDLLSDRGMAHDVAYTVTPLDNGNYLLAATLPRTSGGNYTMSITLDYDDLVDATICSIDQNCYPSSQYLWVGYYPGSGYERALVRPANWTMTETNMPNQVITSAQIILRDVTVTSAEAIVECRAFTGSAWEEETVKWNTANGNSLGALCSENAVSSAIGWTEGYYYTFDITDLVQCWYKGYVSPNKGVIFTWKNAVATEMEKGFASTEYSNENYRPRLVYEYAAVSLIPDGVYYMKSGANNYLSVSSMETLFEPLNLLSKKDTSKHRKYRQLWRVKHIENGYYTIRPYFYTPAAVCNDYYIGSLEEAGYSDAMEDLESYYLWKAMEGPNGQLYLQAFDDEYLCLIDWENSDSSRMLCVGDLYGCAGDSWIFEAATAEKYVSVYDSETKERLYSSEDSFGSIPTRYMQKGDLRNIANLDLSISVCTEEMIDINVCAWSISETSVVLFADSYRNVSALSEGISQLSVLVDGAYVPVFEILVLSPLETGSTCIENVSSGKYVDINNQIAAPGVAVVQSDFHAEDTQIWDVELYNGGPYYTISSTASSTPVYYLGEQNDASSVDSPMVLRYGTVTDGMLWDISLNTRTGKYVLKPKNSDNVMGITSSSSSVISLKERENDDVLCDEWDLQPVKYTLTVNHYYDEGFAARFDSNTTDVLNYAQVETAKMMLDVFGLLCVQNTYSYTSVCDTCKNTGYSDSELEDVLDSSCVCGGSSCLTRDRIREQLSVPDNDLIQGSKTSTTVFWTGHRMDGDERSCSWWGGENPNTVVMTMYKSFPYDEKTGTSTAYAYAYQRNLEASTLFHELCHQFEVFDHYCRFDAGDDIKTEKVTACSNPGCDKCKNSENDTNFGDTVRECAMGHTYLLSEHTAESILCSDCVESIVAHLEDHHVLEGSI